MAINEFCGDGGVDNDAHPELRNGEMFWINATIEKYNRCPYKTKRMGVTAYSGYGDIVAIKTPNQNILNREKLFPIFVQYKEYRAKGYWDEKTNTLESWDDYDKRNGGWY